MPTNTTTNSASTIQTGTTATRSDAVCAERLPAALFGLLRAALGGTPGELAELNTEEWKGLYRLAARQSLLGIVFYALGRAFPDAESRVPKEVYLRLFYQAESIRGLNGRMYALSSQLTGLFRARGARAVILKGQGNSRLYPDMFIRQTGDVDVYVAGGRERVIRLLSEMDLLRGGKCSDHEVTLREDAFGADVEVHFDYIQSCRNPFANRRLRAILEGEMEAARLVSAGESEGLTSAGDSAARLVSAGDSAARENAGEEAACRTSDGFYVPSDKFSMLMQLSHIRKHLLGLGLGLRQVVDYFVLLRASSAEDRREVAMSLSRCGLTPVAGALMWVLSEYLGLESQYLLCVPDARRGRILLREIMRDGNFGKHAQRKRGGVFKWWLKNRLRLVTFLPFDFPEVSWFLLRYWASFVFLTPQRILALRRYKRRHK